MRGRTKQIDGQRGFEASVGGHSRRTVTARIHTGHRPPSGEDATPHERIIPRPTRCSCHRGRRLANPPTGLGSKAANKTPTRDANQQEGIKKEHGSSSPCSFFARVCVPQETTALPLSYIPKVCGDEGNRTPAAPFCGQSGREPAGSFLPLP